MSLPSTMKAAVYDFSKPAGQMIQFVENQPVPAANPRSPDLLVRTLAAALNPADHKLPTFPFARFFLNKTVVGFDICAEVLEDKAGFKKGDVVCGISKGGCLAEYTTVRPNAVVRKPAKLTVAEAAALPIANVTALMACQEAKVKAGDSVAVLGASGGCGSAAVQLARAMGANNVLAVCSKKNNAFVSELGATQCLNYDMYDGDLAAFGAAGPSGTLASVIDTVSSPHDPDYEPPCRPWLRPEGLYVALASPSHLDLLRKLLLFGWFQRRNYRMVFGEFRMAPLLEQLSDFIDQGKLRVTVHSEREFTAEGLAAAVEELHSRRARGKIVLTFPQK
eukprot:EG_transcript_14569